jgi:hypothetical protein
VNPESASLRVRPLSAPTKIRLNLLFNATISLASGCTLSLVPISASIC